MARSPTKVTCRLCRRRFAAITFKHLVFIHGYEREHPIEEYKERFCLAKALCPRGRKKIKKSKKEYWADRGRDWSRLKILDAIRRRHRSRRSLRSKRVPVRLEQAARRLFGSWEIAIRKAGLEYDAITAKRRWTPERIISQIRQLARNQVPLNATYIERQHGALYRAAVRAFPSSWGKAVRAAGLDPTEHKQRRGSWDRDKAVNWVRSRIQKKRSILAKDAPRDLKCFVWDHLDLNWTDFIESFGISYPGIKKRRDWNKKSVVEEIRRWQAQGKQMNYSALKAEYQALLCQAKRFFKSWDAARDAAGV